MKRLLFAAAAAMILAAPAFAALKPGTDAPAFTAEGSLGGKAFTFDLKAALKKGPVVVYFFPAAYTPGCTAETKQFADAADKFKAAGATLIGVTGMAKMADGSMASASESKERLAEFASEHCRDKFPIAAVSPDVIQKYDVVLRGGFSDRTSFVIGQDGKVVFVHTDQKPDQHVDLTLKALADLKTAAHSGH